VTVRLRPLAVLAALGALALPARAQDSAQKVIRKRTTYEDLQMFSQVLNQIRVNHPDTVDTHELLMAAIRGMVHAADPHSYVVSSVQLSEAKQREVDNGNFQTVPIEWDLSRGAPIVTFVHPGTLAAKAGVLPGDELVLADGKPITAESELELDLTLAGPKGTEVALVFERQRADGTFARLDRTVRREKSDASATAVPAVLQLAPGTGYVRITTFGDPKVADDLHKALETLDDQGIQRLVIDLRDNGGGLVKEAAQIAGEFLPRGTGVYTSRGRKAEAIDTGRVSRVLWRKPRTYPIAVMVNAGTASASELVAGALQDHDRAVIVGRPSFGKALMMQGFPMADGSTFVLVIGAVHTPCGRSVQRDYRAITRREYYRRARADRDTVGRPTCTTDNGRVVYGGGGIVPDVLLPEPAGTPPWLARLAEEDLLARWARGWVDAATPKPVLATLEASRKLPDGARAAFATFAASAGQPLPADADAARLERALLVALGGALDGDRGAYRMRALVDPEVAGAVEALARAPQLLAKKK
jgi:carboxyl-terminal processing protease